MTTHLSKGLEFDTVFALGIASRHRLPEEVTIRNGTTAVEVPFEEESPDSLRALEELDAEKGRQLYVALTRAKRATLHPDFPRQRPQKDRTGDSVSSRTVFFSAVRLHPRPLL